MSIRREHELFHYFTYRRFGRIRTHVLDELLADFVGLLRTDGRYDARLALRFLGLDRWPEWRAGGRVENYVRGKLPDEVLPAIGTLAMRAAGQLEIVSRACAASVGTIDGLVRVLSALCGLSLDELAASSAPDSWWLARAPEPGRPRCTRASRWRPTTAARRWAR